MSQIQLLVDTLTHYQTLPHHSNSELNEVFFGVQQWQKQRIHNTSQSLFNNPKTAPLAHYLIGQIYGNKEFDAIAKQLLTAGNNALNGSGRLEKLIPQKTLATGILGVKAAVLAIQLDLKIAQFIHQNDALCHSFLTQGIHDELMVKAYHGVDNQQERIIQIKNIKEVCEQSYLQFNSFLLKKAFTLAKSTAYHHGYQPLYDFIHDGLHAINTINKIEDFTKPFEHTELATIERIYHQGRVYE
ncbi:hypothetical protein LU276_06805 [Moraxella haemolytica]|uniref:FFLEELY motif protein n=1 Tax=Moraxella haemolytica TaxID=2904119 RepID=UPI002542F7BB|nr:hypothetical protein [Moraxella sp. ZY171148]WII94733.1 hypothetical protein LU276_06805 [Moraxella sp. ZY171148]